MTSEYTGTAVIDIDYVVTADNEDAAISVIRDMVEEDCPYATTFYIKNITEVN